MSDCCKGNEILCIEIPGPITIVLLGIKLTLTIPCIRIGSPNPLTKDEKDILAKIFGNAIYKLDL